MIRRGYPADLHCSFAGCKEVGRTVYDTIKDYNRSAESRARWRCIRHLEPGSVVTRDDPFKSVTLTVREAHGRHFWSRGDALGSGFAHGPGFQAHADDFLVGTTLTVTVSLNVPLSEPCHACGGSGFTTEDTFAGRCVVCRGKTK